MKAVVYFAVGPPCFNSPLLEAGFKFIYLNNLAVQEGLLELEMSLEPNRAI